MRFLLPLVLLVVPITEIALFFLIGGQIGLWWTLGMILVTAIAGTALLRVQGFAVMERIRLETRAGRIPGRELAHGLMLLLAGVLLLTPGFFTDAIGFALFLPPLRDAIYAGLKSRLFTIVPGMVGAPFGGAGPFGGMGPFGRAGPFGGAGPFERGGSFRGGPFRRDEGVVDLDAEDYTARTAPGMERGTEREAERGAGHPEERPEARARIDRTAP